MSLSIPPFGSDPGRVGAYVAFELSIAYSAHAEVYPDHEEGWSFHGGLLRACGGLPYKKTVNGVSVQPTPRMRRSTRVPS